MHGGQQPVGGATIQLYAVGTTGDGLAPTPLLTPPVTTNPDGSFAITGLYTCPSDSALVYIVGTGGNPGLGGSVNNTALSLMAALGTCGALKTTPLVEINEVTTVAAVAALAPFMSAPANVGSSASDAAALAGAFQTAAALADVTTGVSPGTATYSVVGQPGTVPVSEINTLANVVAACVNTSGGVATDTSTACGKLLSLTGGTGNTLSALIALEKSPAAFDTASIFNIGSGYGVFQPTLPQAPDNFSVAVVYPATSTSYDLVPKTVYPGQMMYFYSTSSACLTSQLGNQAWFGYPYTNFVAESLVVQTRFYNNGQFIGESGCGRLGGVVPTGLAYGPTGVMTEYYVSPSYQNGVFMTLTVVPAPTDQSLTFDKSTLFSNGPLGAAEFSEETHLRNNTSGTVVLTGATITGSQASAFIIDSSTCSGSLPPQAYCTIVEHYDPRLISGGLIQASLVVSDTTNTLHATAVVAGIAYQ
jgi:hypothetical protein